MRRTRNRKTRNVSVVVATLLLAASCADVAAPPGGPVSNQGYPPQGQPQAMQAPQSHPIRDLFASTIAAVLQTATMGIAGGISGGIVNWFAAKIGQNGNNAYASAGYGAAQYPNGAYGSASTPGYGNTGYPSTAGTYPGSSYPSSSYPGSTYPSTGSYPQGATQYPNSGSPSSSYPTTASGYPNSGAQYPNSGYPSAGTYPDGSYPNGTSQYPNSGYPAGTAQTPNAGYPTASTYPNSSYPNSSSPTSSYPSSGYPNSGNPSTGAYGATNGYGSPSGGEMVAARDTGVYAGIAYEVHAFSADGHWVPVDPLTYQFRSGDRFMVYYRPSLPGRMQVFNINPAGQRTLIDATDMAAGQLAGLGPYEFTNLTGDESLRLVLSPCSTPQLLVATRDIVKADLPPPSDAQTGGGVHLENCSVTATRGVDVQTRDIQKVAADGSTSFALDPVSQQELSTGNVESRQVTIVFHHR